MIEGLVYISSAPATNEFCERFSAFNKTEPDWMNPCVYNILTLMVEGLEQCPDPNKDKTPALNYLSHIKNHLSAVGTISVGPEGVFDVPVCLYKTINGKKVQVTMEEAIKVK